MIIAADVGNSRTKFAGISYVGGGYCVDFVIAVPTAKICSESGGIRLCKRAVEEGLDSLGLSFKDVEGTVLSSVSPKADGIVGTALKDISQRTPVEVSAKCECGITFAQENTMEIGNDRIAAVSYAAHTYRLPAVTVDFGTATTFNVISKDRVFLGGVIAAGVQTGINALAKETAALPEIHIGQAAGMQYAMETRGGAKAPGALLDVIGRNTMECMVSGAIAGAAAMTDGICAAIEKKLCQKATLIVTGGFAGFVAPHIVREHISEEHLTLKGMALIYGMNR